jgi:hypothetical protein
MRSTEERVARNQATFRDANERIEQAHERVEEIGGAIDQEPVPFICECWQRSCTELARLSLDDYEAVRADGRRFLVAPGHELCEADGIEIARIVDRRATFSVMEKVGEAGRIAAELDARTGADG